MLAGRFKFIGQITQDAVFPKVMSLSVILFFIFLGDAILSFWVPNFLQESLNGSAFVMGLVFSFSSIIGLLADVVFPGLLKNFTVRKLVLSAGILGLIFLSVMIIGTKVSTIWLFLLAMAVWGVYYEFLGFGSQQFVADTVPLKLRASGWAILGSFRSMAYFFGPILAGWLILAGNYALAGAVGFFVVLGIFILGLTSKKHERPVSIEISEVNLWRELGYWKTLFPRVWPIVAVSLVLGLIDSFFWTTGAVWTQKLAKESLWGVLILPAYQLPALFMGFVVARWEIYKGKKKIALKFMFLSSLFLVLLVFKLPIFLYILCVFMSSLLLGVTCPLIEAVYSDVVARMGKERKHLVGLGSSSRSIPYIAGPAVAGLIAQTVGERLTFVVIGGVTFLVAVLLLVFTPRKIRLPEKEIGTWE